jgi:hypothetical protein
VDTQPLPVGLTRKDAFTALSVLDCVISLRDDNKTVKTRLSVSKNKKTLYSKDQLVHILRNNDTMLSFYKYELLVSLHMCFKSITFSL